MTFRFRSVTGWLILTVVPAVVVGGLALSHPHWLPAVKGLIGDFTLSESDQKHDHADHDDPHGENHAPGESRPHSDDDPDRQQHSQDDAGDSQHNERHEHDEATALRLSAQARANVCRDLHDVKSGPYAKKISVPATVVRRPGRSQVQIAAPFTGRVTRIYHTEGEAVTPGTPLFQLQLTHEELVDAQADFLRILKELDVVKEEVERVAKVVAEGAIAGKALLERQYEKRKLEAARDAQRQRLVLHGLEDEQIDETILKKRELLHEVTVKVPFPQEDPLGGSRPQMQVQQLKVKPGQHVAVGDPLCTLADYSTLYIQGKAFEQDVPALARAVEEGWKVTAVFQSSDHCGREVPGLEILYLASEVEMQSRAFYFYVKLDNEEPETTTKDGQTFINWCYKPGQRLRLKVPIEPETDRIVLPVESVVSDGGEAYVYEHNEDHFDRRTVQIDHQDQDEVVIAAGGPLKEGVRVARSGAYQIHLATKNKGRPAVSDDGHAQH